MDDFNLLNIPAYKRKRSIAAKARRTYPLKQSSSTTKTSVQRKRRARKTMIMNESTSDIPIKDAFSPPIFGMPESYGRAENNSKTEEFQPQSELRVMTSCGHCEGYFDNIDVAIVQLTNPLRVGDRVLFESSDGLFEQTVESMQIDRKPIDLARSGSSIGLKTLMKPKVGGTVYKVI